MDGFTDSALGSLLLALSSKPQVREVVGTPTAQPELSRLIHDCNGSGRQPSAFAVGNVPSGTLWIKTKKRAASH